MYIDDLVHDLNQGDLTCLAFADDLVVHCPSTEDLHMAIDLTKKWSIDFEIAVNFSKSAIMKIRVDGRTRDHGPKEFNSIPVVNSYKYLGIVIDNSLNLKQQNEVI